PYSGNEGEPVSFAGTGSDPDGDNLTYSWDFGDGTTGSGANPSHVYADNGTYLAKLTVSDGTASAESTANVTIANVAPTAALNGPTVQYFEGDLVELTGSATDPSTADTDAGLDFEWTVTKDGAAFASGQGTAVSFRPDDDGLYVAKVTAKDKDGASDGAERSMQVINRLPAPGITSADSGVEGSPIAVKLEHDDRGAGDTHTYTWTITRDGSPFDEGSTQDIEYGLPNNSGTKAGSHDMSFTPDDNGTYVIALTVTDDDGGSRSIERTITVSNAAPTSTLSGMPSSVDEGSAITLSGSATDPSRVDTSAGFTLSWSVTKIGSPYAGGTGSSFTFTPDDDGTYVATLTSTDKDGGSGSATKGVEVANVAPVVKYLAPVSGYVFPVNTNANFAGSFADPGADSPWSAWWTFDKDGAVSGDEIEVALNTGDGSLVPGSFQQAIMFGIPGVYAASLSVRDKDGAAGTASVLDGPDQLPAFVVVYDPNGGFVTGGGWIPSPAGAMPAYPLAAGKASFGFVSKYQKGATVPTGNTEFQFKAGDLNFKSSSYEWLVVAGAKAQFKGAGTINGGGNYGFLLTAIDGQLNGGGGLDKFRIKIWDRSTGATVYDNNIGAADSADPSTAIGGGSIVIHAK
ncbi:MAG TPA: PKD domain-containing protein, partial [Fimbriimonas sp.]